MLKLEAKVVDLAYRRLTCYFLLNFVLKNEVFKQLIKYKKYSLLFSFEFCLFVDAGDRETCAYYKTCYFLLNFVCKNWWKYRWHQRVLGLLFSFEFCIRSQVERCSSDLSAHLAIFFWILFSFFSAIFSLFSLSSLAIFFWILFLLDVVLLAMDGYYDYRTYLAILFWILAAAAAANTSSCLSPRLLFSFEFWTSTWKLWRKVPWEDSTCYFLLNFGFQVTFLVRFHCVLSCYFLLNFGSWLRAQLSG